MLIDTAVSFRLNNDSEIYEANNNQIKKINKNITCEKMKTVSNETETIVTNDISTWSYFLKNDIKWKNAVILVVLHIIAIYGFITFPYIERYKTVLYMQFMIIFSGFGVTCGAHRFWSHRSFSAKLPLRILLATCFISASQVPVSAWVREHRVHHKFSETNADPHDSRRGFFFSHCGWLMLDKHPAVLQKSKTINMSDIEADPVVTFTDRYFKFLKLIVMFTTVAIPVYCWNESWYYAVMSQFLKFIYNSHSTWCLNSVAHMWGYKPYNRSIASADNSFVHLVTYGEGCHNYHHTFPSDYSTPEIGIGGFDVTTKLIHFFAKIGWAYNLKKSSTSLVERTIRSRGDANILSSALI